MCKSTGLIAILLLVAAMPSRVIGADPDLASATGFAVEEMVCASHTEVWNAVFTIDGMKALGIAQSSVDYNVGGMLMRRPAVGGRLGDDQTIINQIISIDYGRMLSMKPVQMPAVFGTLLPSTVTTQYFTPVANDRTIVRVVTSNVPATPNGKAMLAKALAGTKSGLAALRERYLAMCTVILP